MAAAELRAPTLSDVPALVELFRACQAAFGSGWRSAADLQDELKRKRNDPRLNLRVALEGDRAVGWSSIWQPEPGSGRSFVDVSVLPDAAGVTSLVLDWAESRARELADGHQMQMHVSAGEREVDLADELRRRSYELVRHFLTMEVDLREEPCPPQWPPGITVRTFRPDDLRAVYEADMEAFEDHWNAFTIPLEDWREFFIDRSDFDPALWFLAEEDGQLAGFAICSSERRPDTAHVGVLGVRRPWRRRGVATALLCHAFQEFRRRGRAKADLGVDAENLTGAVRLYERVGMRSVRRSDTYRKEVASDVSSAG